MNGVFENKHVRKEKIILIIQHCGSRHDFFFFFNSSTQMLIFAICHRDFDVRFDLAQKGVHK